MKKTMKFEFAKYTEITDYAFEVNPNYKNEGFVRFFICPDVTDFWFVRILANHNEDYAIEEGCFVLERNNIPKARREELTLAKVKKIILEDDGCNWDIQSGYDIENLIDMLDDGFGILNRKEAEQQNDTN